MAKTCPSCHYSPIGPFHDNCPLCGEPVRHLSSEGFGGAGSTQYPPKLVFGWLAIGAVLAFFFWGDWPWLLLSAGLCGGAWWAAAMFDILWYRILGGSLLAMFVPGVWLAAQPNILPGLDRRPPEMRFQDLIAAFQGTTPDAMRTSARMKTISGVLYALEAFVVFPVLLLVPPLLDNRKRRRLASPVAVTKGQALAGFLGLLLLWPALGWLAYPTVQTWANEPAPPFPVPLDLGKFPVDPGPPDDENQ